MVYELKSPVDESPGLLTFTHKERPFFFDPPDRLRERLRRLTNRYVLGMQWGRYHTNVGETPHIDIHMACPGTADFRDDADIRHIPLCSRNFTPLYFEPMDVLVRWDVFSVGHPITDKRYADILDVPRMVFDAGVGAAYRTSTSNGCVSGSAGSPLVSVRTMRLTVASVSRSTASSASSSH